jgi:hypothetical protein
VPALELTKFAILMAPISIDDGIFNFADPLLEVLGIAFLGRFLLFIQIEL